MNTLGEFVLFIKEQYNLKIVSKVPLFLILIFRKTNNYWSEFLSVKIVFPYNVYCKYHYRSLKG